MTTLNLNATEPSLSGQWAGLSERLRLLNEILLQEMESCWRDLQHILERQVEQLNYLRDEAGKEVSLSGFRHERGEASRRLLIEPLSQWERRRPYKRAMGAIEKYDRCLDELVISQPEFVSVSGQRALELLGQFVTSGMLRRRASMRRKERPLPLRQIIEVGFRRLTLARSEIEGRYLVILAQAIHQIRKNWDVRREALDMSARGKDLRLQVDAAHPNETDKCAELTREAEAALSEWRGWPEMTVPSLARRILSAAGRRTKVKPPESADDRPALLNHWGEQLRFLEAEIDFELKLERREDDLLSLSQDCLGSLERERAGLRGELDGFAGWLRDRCVGGERVDIPAPRIDVVPASARIAALEFGIRTALQTLPRRVRILTHFSALPGRWTKPKDLHPAATFSNAFARTGRVGIESALVAVEEEHNRIVQVIEQAREVVAFGLSTNEREAESDSHIADEALQNALSLLEYHRRDVTDELTETDEDVARTVAAVFVENRMSLTRTRLGVLAYLGQQGVQRAAVIVAHNVTEAAMRFLRLTFTTLQRLSREFLIRIGWMAETKPSVAEVVTRPFLPQAFTVDLSAKELPAIYRRLFRFEAVQDPRFLVGRDSEMEAIGDARTLWEAGRPVAVLIIGERGSGKTSLINCAIGRPLEGLEVVRGEFKDRLSSAAQLREFLAKLLGVDDSSKLESVLAERRRVLIVEELERTFLRQIGHYAAMRELQKLIVASCGTTLWIVVTNQMAFRFLDAAVKLGQSFSHRLNAASASRDALQEAIMLRHRLSGLRLRFSLPVAERTLLNRFRSMLRGNADPDRLFFDSLARESDGVFRTAFEIWLGHIEAVEAGALSLKALTAPNLSPVIDALLLEDLFTLIAILQHGSLKPEEHAVIFQKSESGSRAQIDDLIAREIIEKDPGRPGFRVRPEALRIVQQALYRRNLI